ncbi:MAG: GDSL-type esterase/lipase family protein [Gemmataceae bacterium]|nr:GDSL-type esterase/lipase family protein [Gemmataceae bacterium]
MQALSSGLLLLSSALTTQAAPLELKKGDRICLVGNTLAERMQHHGWLETLITARFPQHDLVFRNLGFSGDELTLRLRSAGFGSPDDWLTRTKADVVFAFFGYNESFAGQAGLDKFKKDLTDYLKHLQSRKYNGTSPPRVVLFSPIAHENLRDPNLPDGKENNERLKLYTAALAEAAAKNGVRFVDLFTPSQALYANAQRPLTINGIHLSERGDRELAAAIDAALFDGASAKRQATDAVLERIRAAVLERNFTWFNRYRTVDGYSIHGGRADLRFEEYDPATGKKTGKINSNREVAQREMEILDVMTANRDKAVWAAARRASGRQPDVDYKVDDGNTPPFVHIHTNKPGSLPANKHLYLGGEEAIQKMKLGKGLKITLFADEKRFPDLASPVQMAWDAKGRLYVAVMPSYPHWKPKEEMNDKVLIFEDKDGDGRADTCKVFADKLHVPTGLEFWNGGLFVGQQPDLMFLKDTDGDDVADVRERVLHGIDSADTHHALNSFVLDPGGALYFQEGTFHHTQVETPYGPPVRCANAGVFRFEPRSRKFEVYVGYGFANPHGHVFDRWGQDFVTDGTGAVNYFAAPFSGKAEYPMRRAGYKPFFPQKTRPCPATEILSSRHFPDDWQGNYLIANVIGFQGIMRYQMKDDGSGFGADEQEPIVSSTDPNFRPSDLEIGPDGALYFLDWQNPIIGHMQHNLRDPNRNRVHGRIYKVAYEGRPLTTPAPIAGQPIAKLLDLLKDHDDRVRYRTRIELSGRRTDEVMKAVSDWIPEKGPEYEHQLLETLWLHQSHNIVNEDLLKRMLSSPDFRARAAATRVLCYWRDRVSDSLELLKKQAADQHPRVRLEAVRAASFFTVPEAVDVPLIAGELPGDYFLDYCAKETLRTLEPLWKAALAAGKTIPVTSEPAARFFLRNINIEQLVKMERTRPVLQEMLLRPGVQDELRRDALRGLAKAEKRAELRVLFDAVARIDDKKDNRDEAVVFDLVRLLGGRKADELAEVRAELVKLATSAQQPVIRQIGYVSLMSVDGSADKAWALGRKSPAQLRDLLAAVPMIADVSVRASLYPKIEPILNQAPEVSKTSGVSGRYVRIELKGKRRTLTLAEVEVFSDGRNVARQGKATQSATAHGGIAGRAIDGNKAGSYGAGGQTHTPEDSRDPWWELDLGQEVGIESIVVYNRTDGGLGKRLQGFTLRILDQSRNEVHRRANLPAPAVMSRLTYGDADPAAGIRAAAMLALTSVRGEETKTFQTLSKFIRSSGQGIAGDRLSAIRALQRIPRRFWPKDDAKPLVEVMVSHIKQIPTKERTAAAALDALDFADALTTLLPGAEAKKYRSQLGELGVRVIRLGTLPERMAYDKDVLVVQAGKPVEFLFENFDLMPHNLVITLPGAMEELGKLAEAQAQDPAAAARHFVPKSNKVLLASVLLQPRETQKLSFTAPSQPGVYPYVCTYPGHWMRMHGALYVVASLDDYLANPDEYLKKNPLVAKDDLLKDRRPRTEWKLEDFGSLADLKGRSYGNGKQMFQAATCVACHKLDNVGNIFGPDLLQLDVKKKPFDVLKDLLDPSIVIHEKFQTFAFETTAGKVVRGIILEETPQAVKIIENPLVKAEPITLKASEIESRQKLPQSIMPKGLLDKLSRDEILDLLAYVLSRGNRHHEMFRSEPHGHGGHH